MKKVIRIFFAFLVFLFSSVSVSTDTCADALAARLEEERHLHIMKGTRGTSYLSIRNTAKKSDDPYGWGDFKWEMTKEQTRQHGAESFLDSRGTKRFGLANIQLPPKPRYEGNQFWIDLGFYSHIGLASILIQKKAHKYCAKDEYENLLQSLREKYGWEKEGKDLDYPNAIFLSHVWVIGWTKIVLNHSCSKPKNRLFSNQSFLLSIRFERRYGL